MKLKKKVVIAIMGLPTSGKTTLGRVFAATTGIRFIDIDEAPARCAPPQEQNIYESDATRLRERARMMIAYTTLHAAVEANLAQGFSIIVAATYSRHTNQDFLHAAVERGGGTLKLVWCQYNDTPEEIARRVADRLARSDSGGCRSVAHYLDDKSRYAGPKFPHVVVIMENGDEGTQRAVQEVLAYIKRE